MRLLNAADKKQEEIDDRAQSLKNKDGNQGKTYHTLARQVGNAWLKKSNLYFDEVEDKEVYQQH